MEPISKIYYKGKTILYIDYSEFADFKDNAEKITLVNKASTEYAKYPKNSVLALVNLMNVRFDMDVINAFRDSREKVAPYKKKEALIGIKGLQKVAYNSIIGLTQRDDVKLFETEEEAKEWLVKD